MNIASQNKAPSRNAGSIVICVLGCMVVVTGLIATMTHSALQARRDMRSQHRLRQTELVLEAGVQRATDRLSSDREYMGESWQMTEAILPSADEVIVEITVSEDNDSQQREVTVIAQLISSSQVQVKRTYRFRVDLSRSNSNE